MYFFLINKSLTLIPIIKVVKRNYFCEGTFGTQRRSTCKISNTDRSYHEGKCLIYITKVKQIFLENTTVLVTLTSVCGEAIRSIDSK